MSTSKKEPSAFKSQWPEGVEANTSYEVRCDDKGRDGGCWLRVFIAEDGDAHVTMQDWENILEEGSSPNPIPSIRVRTYHGGGRNLRTRQALLWLADAIRRDNEENESRYKPT